MAEKTIKKAVGDYVSGFAFESVASYIKYLYEHYFVGIMENGSDNRPDLGVDWWTAEYIADELEKKIETIQKICADLRAYANSGERQPIEVWQREMKSAKKSKITKFQSDFTRQVNKMYGVSYYAELIDDAYRYAEENDVDVSSDKESTLYNNIENGLDDIEKDMSELHEYLVGCSLDAGKSTRKSAKKSIPKSKDTKMSFTDNVNKMRVNNYAKTGNINTVMKKRD